MPIKLTQDEIDLESNPDTIEELCANVSAGGTLPGFCELKRVRYGMIAPWVYGDPARLKAYQQATLARADWVEQTIFQQLHAIATLDLRGAYSPDGEVLPMDQWPADLARAVSGFKSEGQYSAEGEHLGDKKELKLLDKLKAIELLMKNKRMLSDRLEHSGSVSLEQLVTDSRAESPK